MKPGIYTMKEGEYRPLPALNWSVLKGYFKSALAGRENELNPRPPSPSAQLGQRAHAFILENDRFHQDYIIESDEYAAINKTTKEGRAMKAAFLEEANGREVVSFADGEKIQAMRNRFMSHPQTESLLNGADLIEQVVIWERMKGLKKCKVDLVRDGILYDYKTTSDDLDYWSKSSVFNWLYHGQIAYYHQGLSSVLNDEIRAVKFIVQQTFAPYDLCVFNVTENVMGEGRRLVQHCEQRYYESLAMSYWAPFSIEEKELGSCPEWLRV